MIKYSDLRDLIGVVNPPILLCVSCGCELSAHKGDYFIVFQLGCNQNDVIRCCGHPMRYVRKQLIYTDCDINEDLPRYGNEKDKPTEVK